MISSRAHRLGALALAVALAGDARAEAMRIVALAPSVTETLFAIGAGGDVVGVSDLSDFPPEARSIERVGSYLQPNVEAVVARRPDVVIAVPSPGNREAVEALGDLGLRVEIVEEGRSLADALDAIERIAALVGRRAQGAALRARIRGEIESVRGRVAGSPRRRVLMVIGQNPFVAVGDGNLLDELLRLAGADNVAAGLGRWPRLSVEFVVRSAPDVVVDASMGDEAPASLAFYEGLSLAAAKRGHVYSVRLDEVLRPGPRIGEGFALLARLVHPEAFAAGSAP